MIVIQVTAIDIRRGKQHIPWKSPIARAIKRKLKINGYFDVMEYRDFVDVYLSKKNKEYKIKLPKVVRDFTYRYDNNLSGIKPFSFNLKLPVKM